MIPINQAYQGGTLMLFWEHPLVMENSGPRAQQKQKKPSHSENGYQNNKILTIF